MSTITDTLIQTLQNLIGQLTGFVFNFIGASVLFLVGWLVAKLCLWGITKLLENIGIDRLGDKLNKIDFVRGLGVEIKLSAILGKLLYYFVLLIFLASATELLKMQIITDILAKILALIPKIITAAFMLLAGLLIADSLKKSVVVICNSLNISTGKLLGSVVFFFVMVIALIAALGQADINTSLLESSFNLLVGGVILAFAVGYGFASRDVLANILSSFYSKNKFKEGQIIAIDGIKGTIVDIDNTSITLQTGATKTIIPLHTLQTKTVEVFD
jgi:small-conductance mechanosensitive channel